MIQSLYNEYLVKAKHVYNYFNNYFNIPDFEWGEIIFEDKESCLIKSTMYQNYYYDGEQLLIELKR